MAQKKLIIIIFSIIAVAVVVNLYAYFNREITLSFYSHPDKDGTIALMISNFEKEYPRIKIKLIELPDNTDEKFEIISSSLALRDGTVDVVDSDVIWPSIFVASNLVENLSPYYSEDELNGFLLSALNASTVNGKLYGAPYRIDAGMLYYRSDLLKKYNLPVPKTWDELIQSSKIVTAKEKGMYGYAGSLQKFEGLTCNFFELLWGNNGTLYDNYNNLSINPTSLTNTFNLMSTMMNDGIIPMDATEYSSGDLRNAFKDGKILFMRDWPTGYKSLTAADSPVKDVVGVAPLPVSNIGTPQRGTFGGWVYMMSSHSKHKKEAMIFIKYLTSESVQIQNASIFNYLPSIKSLYSNEQVVKDIPYLTNLETYFNQAESRPRKSNYDLVSFYIQGTVHSVLKGDITPSAAAEELKNTLEKIQ